MNQLYKHHLNVNTVGVNRLSAHNYFIPRNTEEPFANGHGGKRFFSLDGRWEFDLFENELDYEARGRNGFRSVSVPSCWQFYSSDRAAYVNDKYTFPYDPPLIPEDGIFGIYEKSFEFYPEGNRSYRLFFEGADSCLYVFLNGAFVGYSEISHSVSEFDVTEFLKEGENRLSVRIYKYSTGSYLENQDKIRLNGLFGSVYLVARDREHIRNYKISYTLQSGNAHVNFAFSGCDLIKKVTVINGDKRVQAEGVDGCDLVVENVALWNSEIPKRYRVEIVCGEEKICDHIAFRTVSIEKGIFLVNGKTVKLHGVNRHCYACETGYHIPHEVMLRDIKLMKACGINAVRTSHYPPAPAFIELCEEYGLYVVEEADIETHGVVKMNGGHQEALFDAITENDDFALSIRARIENMTARDHNRGCVIVWSAGNEAGYGKHIISEIRRLQESDPSRLVHYESLYTRFPERNCYRLPIISKMYAAPDELKKLLREDDRPVMLCEYSHSMGNSCGDLGEYYELFEGEPKMMGGFVWEWSDQAFPREDGVRMGYGGDFDEPINDGNFCLDGLLDEKRNPKSAYYELRNLNCPLRVVKNAKGYALKNTSVFETLSSATVEVLYCESDGAERRLIYKLEPNEETQLALQNDKIYNFTFIRGGDIIGTACIGELKAEPCKLEKAKAEITSFKAFDILRGGDLELQIGKGSGLPERILSGGVVRLENCKLRAVRAPLDNDGYVKEGWRLRGLFRTYTLAGREEGDGLCYRIKLCADGVGNIFEGRICYELLQGALKISLHGRVNENIEYLPRFGLEFSLPQAYQEFSYLGHGPHECYADKKNLAMIGRFSSDLKDEYIYLRPQEANSHLGTAEVTIDNMRFTADKLFSFNYSSYSIEQLVSARHGYDLKKEGATKLILDYGMSGVGSGSCGPALNRRFALTDKSIEIDFFVEFMQESGK